MNQHTLPRVLSITNLWERRSVTTPFAISSVSSATLLVCSKVRELSRSLSVALLRRYTEILRIWSYAYLLFIGDAYFWIEEEVSCIT